MSVTLQSFDEIFDKDKMRDVFGNYWLRDLSPESAEWQDVVSKQVKRWKGSYWKKKFKLLKTEKNVEHVKSSYEKNWQLTPYPQFVSGKEVPCLWRDSPVMMAPFAEKLAHLMMLNESFKILNPKSVLEVGSGNGVVSIMCAGGFPSADFYGVELTDTGVANSKETQCKDPVPDELVGFAPFPLDSEAIKKVNFRQGNAKALDFADASVDLVYTSLALEQMAAVHKEALREIVRVSKKYVVFIEPFKDANISKLRRYYTGARDYFPMSIGELESYGLKPIFHTTDFPAKVFRGVAFVVAEKI